MARNRGGRLYWLVALGAFLGIGVAGCAQQVGDAVLLPMRVILRKPQPVRIGINRFHLNPLEGPWTPLEQAMGKKLGREVHVFAYTPFQLQSLLQHGYLDFAILSATDYAEIGGEGCCLPLVRPINSMGRDGRHGLIIVRNGSKIESLADLKGHRFAFGPAWDATSHIAAAYTLMQAGLQPKDIPYEMLPVPMTRQHHTDSSEVARHVVTDPLTEAGAIDELAYTTWQAQGPRKGINISILLPEVQGKFHVLATTVELPEGPIVASKKADPKLVARVKEYLLSGQVPEKALKDMDWQRLVPLEAGEYAQVTQMMRELHEAGWVREEVPAAPATQPGAATQLTETDRT